MKIPQIANTAVHLSRLAPSLRALPLALVLRFLPLSLALPVLLMSAACLGDYARLLPCPP